MASDTSSASRRLLSMNNDLWMEIFKRMPIITLCRLRSVCKSWNSHLSSPSFATTYRLLNTVSITRPSSFFRNQTVKQPSYALHHQDDTLTGLDLPIPSHERYDDLEGSFSVIHGVVFFDYKSFRREDGMFRLPDSVALWNPSIRKYVSTTLPKPGYKLIGFGFDGSKNDFKVVWCPQEKMHHHYKVFSVGEGVWRNKELPDYVKSITVSFAASCFLTGNIHWVYYTPSKDQQRTYHLLVFNCECEEFRTMDLGDLQESHTEGPPRIFVRSGLLTSVIFKLRGTVCEVWSMKEYGVVSSWTKDQVCIVEDPIQYMRAPYEEFEEVVYDKVESNNGLIGRCAFPLEESLYLMDTGKPSAHHFRSNLQIGYSTLWGSDYGKFGHLIYGTLSHIN